MQLQSTCMKFPEQATSQKQNVDQWLPGVKEWKKWGITANGYLVSFWGAENVQEIDNGHGCPPV